MGIGRPRRGQQHDERRCHEEQPRQAVQPEEREGRHCGQPEEGRRQGQENAPDECTQGASEHAIVAQPDQAR